MGHRAFSAAALAAIAVTALLSACGGGGGGGSPAPAPAPPAPTTFTVGGTVMGLTGTGLVLRNNGGNDLAIAANGAFSFATALASGGNYSVTVQTQPTNPTQTCTVGSGSGVVAANVTNVTVTCVNTYTVGGTITGLAGVGLVLRNNSESHAILLGATSFTFPTRIPSGGSYSVVVNQNPIGPLQTCTASNASGNVASSDVTNITIACVTHRFSVGGTVSGLQGAGLVLRNNGGDSLPINANGAFTFPTPVDSAAAYDVVAFTHPLNPDQECTTTRGSGTIIDAAITNVAINCYVMGRFLFATNSLLPGTLTGATINQTTGVLDAISGVPVTSGAGANGPTVTPNGRFLYVTNRDAATISGFSVHATTGVMTPVPNSPVPAGQLPIEPPSVDPTGRFLYATDQTNPRLFGYRIDPATGELTALPGSPYTTADRTIYVRVDPTGRFVYVVTRSLAPILNAIALSAYSIDQTTGALTAIGAPIAVGTSMPNPGAMELSSDGAALFILPSPQPSPGQMYGYTLSATTGAPTAMAGSPFTLPASAYRLQPHPSLPVLYVGGSNSIAAYTIGATLTPLAGSPSAIGGSVLGMVLDPGARFLYAGANSSGLSIYEIRSDGALEPLTAGNLPTPFPPSTLVADPGGRYFFISEFTSGTIQPVAVNTRTGRLSLVQGSAFNGGSGTNNLAIAK